MKKNPIIKFIKNNFFIVIFLAIILLVGLISVIKVTNSNTTSVYIKVKLGQGLWWAGGNKPGVWMTNSIKKGDFQNDLLGRKIAVIEDVTYYPYWGVDQYDVYLTVKLDVGGNPKTGKFSFNRANIGIGSPIELALNSLQTSGTIIEMNTEPLKDNYTEKIITLYKRYAFPWEYDAIKIGDTFNNGKNIIFEVIDKLGINTTNISSDIYGNSDPSVTEMKKYINVKAKIKVKQINGQYILGEDQVIRSGKTINMSTTHFTFTDYIIGDIQ